MLNWTPWLRQDEGPRRDPGDSPVALAVCGSGVTPRVLLDGACGARVVTTSFLQLDDALARHRPSLVLSHAVSREFDALDLGTRLVERGFGGRFAVVACDVASPAMVRLEIARACPELEVEVLYAVAAEPQLLRAV